MRLAAEGLAIGHGRVRVAGGISLSAGPGEVLCLLGPNGSGKTTLFRTLLGLIPALEGEVTLGGDPAGRLSRAEIARRVAFVPQAHLPVFPFPAREVVLMGRSARLGAFAQPGPADREIAAEAMERIGIADLAERDYTRLSGGQRQLVLIARALAQEAPLLVMDEPTASLDFGNQARVLGEIAALAGRNLGVVLSTHDPDHALALGTRVVVLHEGAIAAEGAPGEVLTAELLTRVYGVPVSVETLPGGRRVCVPAIG